MSKVVLKRRHPLEVVKYILEKLEKDEVKRGGFPLLIHQALEAVDAAAAERGRFREMLIEVHGTEPSVNFKDGKPYDYCPLCDDSTWPCKVARALASGEESRAEEPGR